jgi:hypothetical protein
VPPVAREERSKRKSSVILFGLCVTISAVALDNSPVPQRAVPVQKAKIGIAIDKPYRWMEDQARRRVDRFSQAIERACPPAARHRAWSRLFRRLDAQGGCLSRALHGRPSRGRAILLRTNDFGTQQPKLIALTIRSARKFGGHVGLKNSLGDSYQRRCGHVLRGPMEIEELLNKAECLGTPPRFRP